MMINGFRHHLILEIQEVIYEEQGEERNHDIRVQTSSFSDPTATQAIQNYEIEKIVESGKNIHAVVRHSENRERIRRKVNAYRRMRKEFEIVYAHLDNARGKQLQVFTEYIEHTRSTKELADENHLTPKKFRRQMDATKKQVVTVIRPYFVNEKEAISE